MDATQYRDSDYMTVGEIAEKAGVTIRTVQYYDQKGLLKPSAKGSRNLRLYTKQDLDQLYRILCYKFLGLTLDEIRDLVKEDEMNGTGQQIEGELQKRIEQEERMISERMKRYALLKDLQSYTECHEVESWGSYTELLDYLQEKWRLIWEINRAYEDDRQTDWETSARKELKEYYRLITETIRLIREGIPPQSEEAKAIIEQYESMKKADLSGDPETEGFEKEPLIFIDPLVMATDAIDYTGIWKEIISFFGAAKRYYLGADSASEAADSDITGSVAADSDMAGSIAR